MLTIVYIFKPMHKNKILKYTIREEHRGALR